MLILFISFPGKLWTSPELLRENIPPPLGTQAGDVYSFAVVCFEVVTRSEPYNFDNFALRGRRYNTVYDFERRLTSQQCFPLRPSLAPTVSYYLSNQFLLFSTNSPTTGHQLLRCFIASPTGSHCLPLLPYQLPLSSIASHQLPLIPSTFPPAPTFSFYFPTSSHCFPLHIWLHCFSTLPPYIIPVY